MQISIGFYWKATSLYVLPQDETLQAAIVAVFSTVEAPVSGHPRDAIKMSVTGAGRLCTYQRPSRRGDPGEPLGICTTTFTNPVYPNVRFFNQKLQMSLPWGKDVCSAKSKSVLFQKTCRN